ncbi:MAG: hypothetical protein JXB49_08590 [Bacteroidales bacterium]|nr:hypothetical protein [Bacteroidales bacterium]
MKILNKIISIILLAGIAYTSHGQRYKTHMDTIKISIDNSSEIIISTYDKTKLHEDSAIYSVISSLYNDIQKIKTQLPEFEYYLISYSREKSINIDELKPKSEFILSNGTFQLAPPRSKCIISEKRYFITLLFNNIDDINDEMQNKLSAVISELPEKGRQANTMHYEHINNRLTHIEELDTKNGDNDMLVILADVGGGIIKNNPECDMSLALGASFSSHGLTKNYFYCSLNDYIIFDDNNTLHENYFVNLGWKVNKSRQVKKQDMIGIEIGYLAYRRGDFFDKNTIRISYSGDLGKYVTFSPQFYFYDNFNKAYPGIRFGFHF